MIDDFIVPANLKSGDKFYDENYGNLTINKVEQHLYAGAMRTVAYATAGENAYIWDQATGVCVEGTSATPDFTMHSIIDSTNMWQPNEGFNMVLVTLLAAIAAIIVLLVVAVALWFKRRRKAKTVVSR